MGKGPESQPTQAAEKLSPDSVTKLMEKYGPHGLQQDAEYFIVPNEKERKTTYLHKFPEIGETPIEDRVKELLNLK